MSQTAEEKAYAKFIGLCFGVEIHFRKYFTGAYLSPTNLQKISHLTKHRTAFLYNFAYHIESNLRTFLAECLATYYRNYL